MHKTSIWIKIHLAKSFTHWQIVIYKTMTVGCIIISKKTEILSSCTFNIFTECYFRVKFFKNKNLNSVSTARNIKSINFKTLL